VAGIDLVAPEAHEVVDGPGRGGVVDVGVVARRRASLVDLPLWLDRLVLGPGAGLRWSAAVGAQALFVTVGTIEVDGRSCGPGTAVGLDPDAALAVVAPQGAEVVHLGAAADDVPRGARGAGVHVVGPEGRWARADDEKATRFFLDSDCSACGLTLFTTARTGPYVSAPHSHSAPEILHVVDGTIEVGRRSLGPGSTIGIAADRRYGFRSPGAFTFLNFRPGPSAMTTQRGGPAVPEGARAHGFSEVAPPR
jgi:quercetin dioxygenase-like cupin family protein